jgi:hypothetical protein
MEETTWNMRLMWEDGKWGTEMDFMEVEPKYADWIYLVLNGSNGGFV